jgi:hypothetical protein
MTRPHEDDHVCPTNVRCPVCHSIPLHIHRNIIERGDMKLTETKGYPLLNRKDAL